MLSISFRKHLDEKKENSLVTFIIKMQNVRQQLVLVLCLHRVIETRVLTSQRACFLRAVLKAFNTFLIIVQSNFRNEKSKRLSSNYFLQRSLSAG